MKLNMFHGMIRSKKGTALILEQIFVVVFGILILTTVIVVFSNVRQDSYDFIANSSFFPASLCIHGFILFLNETLM